MNQIEMNLKKSAVPNARNAASHEPTCSFKLRGGGDCDCQQQAALNWFAALMEPWSEHECEDDWNL